MWGATLFILQQIYIFVYAHVGFVSHNESSVHGYASFKTSYLVSASLTVE